MRLSWAENEVAPAVCGIDLLDSQRAGDLLDGRYAHEVPRAVREQAEAIDQLDLQLAQFVAVSAAEIRL